MLKTHFESEMHCVPRGLYYDTELQCYFAILKHCEGNKFTGKIMIPPVNVAAAHVSAESIPTHQPIGTKPERDTPGGTRKDRTVKTAKSAIEKKIMERKSAKTE